MSFESLVVVGTLAAVLLVLAAMVIVARARPRSGAADALGAGDFEGAWRTARTTAPAERDELMAAAVAAKHLLRLEESDELLSRVAGSDPADGEVWLERGLVAAYRGDFESASRALARAEGLRSDLLESITLHRAWLELVTGAPRAARHRFEEVESSLENKLRDDLGGGEPLFAEWFLQAADLWAASGDAERARWAREQGAAAAPGSRLAAALATGRRPPLVDDATAPA
ncbi:MAG: hypothetical protein R3325_07605 [Thermoanaerobaculia bacterium]|nr:hypothetical protein [Thermoanaerobaculia bacterium]